MILLSFFILFFYYFLLFRVNSTSATAAEQDLAWQDLVAWGKAVSNKRAFQACSTGHSEMPEGWSPRQDLCPDTQPESTKGWAHCLLQSTQLQLCDNAPLRAGTLPPWAAVVLRTLIWEWKPQNFGMTRSKSEQQEAAWRSWVFLLTFGALSNLFHQKISMYTTTPYSWGCLHSY